MKNKRVQMLAFAICFLLSAALPALALQNSSSKLTYESFELYDCEQDKMLKISLEQYTANVCTALAGDESLSEEALSALAVASRSCALLMWGRACKGQLCTCPSHSLPFEKNIRQDVNLAVVATKGEILVHNGAIVPAFVHQSSYLATESAYNLLDEELSFLSSVTSAESAPKTRVHINRSEFVSVMRIKLDVKNFTADDEIVLTRDNTGRVKSVESCGVLIEGSEFVRAFALVSSCFEINKEWEDFEIICQGCGSGLGMSLMGAEHMASEGKSYTQILTHYFKGCEIALAPDTV